MPEITPVGRDRNQETSASNGTGEVGGLGKDSPSALGGAEAVSGIRPNSDGAQTPAEGNLGESGTTKEASDLPEQGNGDKSGGESEANNRPTPPRKHRARPNLDAAAVARALREADGNRKLAAAALGVDVPTIASRILANPQLKALWGMAVNGAEGPPVHTETQAMNRKLEVVPGLTPEGVELAQMVSENDNEILRRGLKKLGVSDKMVARLKTLDGLAQSSGHFLSISLEKTHRLYFLQLIHLNEVADELRGRILAKSGEPGFIASDEARAFFNRNYVEFVKEAGNGYKLMMEGASNMVRMLQASKNDEDAPGASGKPKWGRIKKTEAVAPDAKD